MLKAIIIGSGDVVVDRHAPLLADLAEVVSVVAVTTRRPDRHAMVERGLGYSVRRIATLADAIEAEADIALVAVPESAMFDVASLVVNAGFATYIEKPMAADSIAASKLGDAIRLSNRPAVIGENFRHQQRFSVARSAIGAQKITHVAVRDRLRRGMRSNPRSDDELIREQIVHSASAVRFVLGDTIAEVVAARREQLGSALTLQVDAVSSADIPIRIALELTNTWSEDRYSFTMGNDASLELKHNYDFSTKLYNDRLETWAAANDLVQFSEFIGADSGMTSLWHLLIDAVIDGSETDLALIGEGIRDIQFREAVDTCIKFQRSVPIPRAMASTFS